MSRRYRGFGAAQCVCLCLLACLCSAACASNLKLTRIASAARAPGNVAVFFSVDTADGEPVTDLTVSDLRISEDGEQLSLARTQQTLLDDDRAAAHATVLIVDMSTSARGSDLQHAITLAVSAFVNRVKTQQRVAVYAFDGGRFVYEILPFAGPASEADVTAALNGRLRAFETHDPATNLNGALLLGLSHLDDGLRVAHAPRRFGNLVVFTDGTDRANRVPYQQVIDAVEASPYRVYTLGLGREVDDSMLSRFGKTGYLRVEESATLDAAFRELAERIVRFAARQYLLSYCSPARDGTHLLSIEAFSRAHAAHGQLELPFSAERFGPGCDATQPPNLSSAK